MMRIFPAEVISVLRSRDGQRNLRILGKFLLVLATMIVGYSIGFHCLMEQEGQQHSWISGFYWTLSTMSTLGFGDITFKSDLGRAYSIVVLLSGTVFLLILLPFTFIEFFYGPWMASQASARAPKQLSLDMKGHVLLTHHDPVTSALIRRLEQFHYPYAVMVPDLDEALRLHDLGLDVVVGALDDPEAWRRARVDQAALVTTTRSDVTNTHVAFTVRGIAEKVPIVATAKAADSVDVLELAGSNHVLRLEEMIARSFARRMIGGDALAHVIGRFDDILIAEANTHRTPLVGKTLREADLRKLVGVSVIGGWERGVFEPAGPEKVIHDNTVLVLACTRETLERYNEMLCIYNVSSDPVLIIGGGRVGRATARALAAQGSEYVIIEMLEERSQDKSRTTVGNAADLETLKKAGLDKAPTIVITPRDDELNVYLTVYCRRLRPDVQIICRATHERNVDTLHRAGADMVMSYATMGANRIMDVLKRGNLLTVAEGLDLFRAKVPRKLAGKKIVDSSIREETGCSVVAIGSDQHLRVVPDPMQELVADEDMILIGTKDSEREFLRRFSDA